MKLEKSFEVVQRRWVLDLEDNPAISWGGGGAFFKGKLTEGLFFKRNNGVMLE